MTIFLESKKQKNTIAHDDFKACQTQVKLSDLQGNCQPSNAFQRLVENTDNAIVIK